MKKTKKVLSVVLSFLVALASMPALYTATVASGTVDNPTTALEESNPYKYDDLFKLNISHSNNNFFFYQTIDDEYFVAKQSLALQQYKVSLGSNRTLTFHGINFYEGGSNIAQSTDSAGIIEEPTIVNNPTSEFISKYRHSHSWVSTHNNSAGKDCTGDVNIEASGWDLNGSHKNYSWEHSVIFKGHSAGVTGQINTGYYERLTWDWVSDDSSASMDFRIKTTITVVDARAFVKELAEKEAIVANPQGYSAAYVSAVQSALDDIPAELKNLSVRYTQSIVNYFTETLTSIPENCADYSEFNRVLAESRAFANDGTYSIRSYNAYREQIESINAGVPKNLDASQQEFIDGATQALKDAKNLLVIEFPGSGSSATSEIEDLTPVVSNEFNFIQVEDDQILAFTQDWTMSRGSKSSNRMFYITLDTTDSNTASFLSRLTTDCVTTVPELTSGAFSGTKTNQTIFTNWYEVDANGNPKADVEAITDGVIDPNYGGFQERTTYYFKNGLSFVGLSADESGARTYTYNQTLYVNWTQWIIVTVNHYNTTTYTTTINITDARPLVEAYNDALATLENPGEYSERYIETLEDIVNSVPENMINGTKYYTQDVVDKHFEAITTLNDRDADYSGLGEAYQRVEEILANPNTYSGATLAAAQAAKDAADALDRNLIDSVANRELIASVTAGLNSVADNAEARADYTTYNQYIDICHSMNPVQFTGDAYAEFVAVVESVKSTLPLDLGVSQQGAVDEACNTLLDAYLKLTGGSITDPDSTGEAFTQDSITGEYTNGVIKFSVKAPEYNFTQTLNDEKLSIKTNLTISSADANYTVTLDSLKISSLDKGEIDSLDSKENCYNSESVSVNQAENLFCYENIQYDVVTGVEMYSADANGDMAHFTRWQNTAGVPLSTGGIINASTILTTEESSASAEYIYASVGGGDTTTKARSHTYVLRLAWSETDNATGVTTHHHAHIPVTLNISDARELRSTYYSYTDFLKAGNDGTYTDASFADADKIINGENGVNIDIVNGKGYYTQEQINAEFAKLVNASEVLQTKADYSAFNSAVEKLDEILDAPAGTYIEDTMEAVAAAKEAADALNKDLASNDQATVDSVTAIINSAVNSAEEKADYTEFDKAVEELEEIVNAPEGTYTDETVKNAQDALDNVVAGTDKDLPASEQDALDEITSGRKDVTNSAEEKADYTEFDKAVEELENIVNAEDGTYTDETVKNAQAALDNVVAGTDKDLPASEQGALDEITSGLKDVINSAEEKADYTEFNKAVEELEEIVNAPEGTYTDESVKNAQGARDREAPPQQALLPASEQDALDEITSGLKDVINSAEEKADYTEFDKAVEELEEIVNAPEGTYTDETVKNAQDALDNIVAGTDKDLPASEQGALDEITSGLKDVINSAEEKADYTDYNNAKAEADSIVNDDGNGNPIYDEDAFNAFKDAVADVDTALDKDLSADEQSKVDDAFASLENLKTELENKKIYTITFVDSNGEAISTVEYVNGATFGSIDAPALPEDTDTTAYIGWINNGELVTDETKLTGDFTLEVAQELKKLVANEDSTLSFGEEYVSGADKNTTVSQLKAELQNDELVVEGKHYTGVGLESEALVGTGSTITLKSKYTGVIYETKTIIIYGDVDGDGDVDAEDFEKSEDVGIGAASYEEGQNYFFIANDVCKDGYIDALDCWMIGLIQNGKRTVLSV